MNNNYNDNDKDNDKDKDKDNDKDNIRLPDPITTDRLIDDDYYTNYNNPIFHNENDYDLDKILQLTKNDFDFTQEAQEQKEIQLICSQMKEQEEKQRKNKFNNLKTQLHKIILFDRENSHYYELILSIIEMFENGFITEYKTNINEYTNIFRIIKTIRIPTDETINLEKLILTEL